MIKGKKVIITLLCLLFTIGALGKGDLDTTKVDTAELIIKTSMSYVGIPYRWGKSDPSKGFDCSGFTKFIFSKFGYDLPRNAKEQYDNGYSIKSNCLKIGDLVFFKGRKQNGIRHVGIITKVEPTQFYFIHSSSKGVGIDCSKTSYYNKRFIGAKRILNM